MLIWVRGGLPRPGSPRISHTPGNSHREREFPGVPGNSRPLDLAPRELLNYNAADATAARTWVEDGATSQEHAAALLKNRLYRRWGIKTAREYARIKIDGLRLVGGNPDFTNAPGHGDDDARFYDRQQAYVHARGG